MGKYGKRELAAWFFVAVLGLHAMLQGFAQRGLVDKVERLALENHIMRVHDERANRSRDGIGFWKPSPKEWERMQATTVAYCWPQSLLRTLRQIENGSKHHELGVQAIPEDIREHWPPEMWQEAAATRIMIQEAGRLIVADKEVQVKYAKQFGARYNGRPGYWKKFLLYLKRYTKEEGRGHGVKAPDKQEG